jgi:hypothetical protein
MGQVLRSGLKIWRRFAGEETTLERFFRRQFHRVKSCIEKKYIGPNFVVFWSGSKENNRIGIYIKGSCDLLSIFSCQPMIHNVLDGTCCILREGAVWDSRSDFIVQSLQDMPKEWIAPVIKNLKLPDNYFSQNQMFKSSMVFPMISGTDEIKKKAIIMSIGPDVIRTLYQHKEHGFLVDPGGWWFNQSMSKVLSDLSVAAWFRKNFVNIGRIPVNEFIGNLTRIIGLLKENTGAHIIVFNVLTVEPGNLTHNYQFVKDSLVMRARKFNIALAELSGKLDFSILDVDRVLKKEGVNSQIDYAHFPPELYRSVAGEAFRIMGDSGIF